MSELDTGTEEQAAVAPSRLDTLKARADLMGVSYHPKISAEKLEEKIAAHLAGDGKDDKEVKEEAVKEDESVAEKRSRMKQEAMKLVRIRLTCMNQAKKNWKGELITVANNLVKSSRYVPFNAQDNGWHVEQIILNVLRERKYAVFQDEPNGKGGTVRRSRLVPEFAIEVLPPLTPAEIKELARTQAMREGSDV